MRVDLINLDRDKERLARFHDLNAHLPDVVRCAASDGQTLDREELVRAGFITADAPYNNGALGNAHSHTELWRQAIRSNEPVTVAEDDAIFSKHFSSASEAFLAKLPADWDMVMWGWNFDALLAVEIPEGVSYCVMRFDQTELRENIERFRALETEPTPLRLRHCFGTMAYTMRPAAAKTLLDICLPLGNVTINFPRHGARIRNKTIDVMMNTVYPNLKAYACLPPLAVSENRHDTSHTMQKR